MSKYRKDFPCYEHYPNLAYLDSAASSQKVACVLEAMTKTYTERYANVHRGIYHLSDIATGDFEAARVTVGKYFNANPDQIIFVRGATEAINLVATSFTQEFLQEGDEVIISRMEHHANIVPWYRLCHEKKAKLVVIECDAKGVLDMDAYRNAFNPKTKMVALTHISNVLGTINPAKEMIAIAKSHQVPILIDGAQAAAHIPVDISDLDPDFYTASAHKMYGPTGVGFLYVKKEHLKGMSPYQSGGNMIASVSFDDITYLEGPMRFEAGTPHIAGSIGFARACEYMMDVGMSYIQSHEQALLMYLQEQIETVDGLEVFGQAPNKIGIVSFAMKGVHPHDIASILDEDEVAVRAGHHCAMPLVKSMNQPALTRISLGLNNNERDIDQCIKSLKKVREIFSA